MTLKVTQCDCCENYIGCNKSDQITCKAFTDGIPDDLLNGNVSHTKPYAGDNGIMFEPIPGAETFFGVE